MPAGFPKPVATLARCLLSLIPTEHDNPVPEAMTSRICSASTTGSSTRTDIGLVPSPHLDRMAEVAEQAHHLLGGLVVGAGVRGQERRVRTSARGGAQRHPGMHAELASRIRRARDDFARFGRIAVAADDDRQPGQFGVAAHFDGGQKLVEVDVQHPLGHVPQSLRANVSHASPRESMVWPPSVSWWWT